jgi:hypothetical protein
MDKLTLRIANLEAELARAKKSEQLTLQAFGRERQRRFMAEIKLEKLRESLNAALDASK